MGQLVLGYLDFAKREQIRTMEDWTKHLDNIFIISDKKLLMIVHIQAVTKATDEYKKYQAKTFRDYSESLKILEDKVK